MREPAKLNFSPEMDEFKPKPKRQKAVSNPVSGPAEKAVVGKQSGEAEGFSSRTATPKKIDGRTLRRTGRTQQMNISVDPAVKERFLRLVHEGNFRAGGEFLEVLLDEYEGTRS